MSIDDRAIRSEADDERETETTAPSSVEFVEGIDYYTEAGLFVFTEHFLRQRGYCCENNCRHCPYQDSRSNPT